jgi:hypothetical protein
MMDATSYGGRSAEARSILCDQLAVWVRIIAEVGRVLSSHFFPRSGSASRKADGEYLFWAEFLFRRKPQCTMHGQLDQLREPI